jgi:2-polyprenyl-6-methoxyphenol hydroxylase-like FAD-dependent oxidoreductase
VLALSLTRQGIPVRIIDKNQGPGEASRAIVVHARTLEFYDQLGFVDDIVSKGIKVETIHLRENKKEFAHFSLKDMGNGLSPFPFALSLPQDDHEKVLVDQLKRAGVNIEWGTELKSFTQDRLGVRAILDKAGTEEVTAASYLCGCDGAHSRVRKQLNIGFPGGTYDKLFYVADVKTNRESGSGLSLQLGSQSFVLMVPVRTSGSHRLIGTVPADLASKEQLSFDDLRQTVEPVIGTTVDSVNWFSTYRVHHRVADKFREGRSFLLGDAGHLHSPAGGQGMNTGIGDAVNLSWKLAKVIGKQADPSLLDTYETERISFARKLVASTDKAFDAMVGGGLRGTFTRAVLVPYLVPLMAGFSGLRRKIFTTVSQVTINYRHSSLSEGKAGHLEGGDRLPWISEPQSDNHKCLQRMNWQVHIYGDASPAFVSEVKALGVDLYAFPDKASARKAGIKPDGAYLIRPDGYVALAMRRQDATPLKNFIEKHGLVFKQANAKKTIQAGPAP